MPDALGLPDGISDDLRTLATLPPAAKSAYRDVLEPHLGASLDDRADAAAARFARAHGSNKTR